MSGCLPLLRVATIVLAVGCAKGNSLVDGGAGGDSGPTADASCGDMCDHDGDGVVDGMDKCPNTPAGEMVNHVGCSDSQLMPMLETMFPPYGLAWTQGGDLGRAGGLRWTYANIDRKDLFHIYWLVCDDPMTRCGLSLDGAIDASEYFAFSAADSDLTNGKLVYTNTTHILLADTTTPQLSGRLTVTIVDGNNAPIHFADTATLHVTARQADHGAEITGTAFNVVALAEVQDMSTSTWTPYLDYYDAAPTPTTGGSVSVSLDGAFYDK
jgi:hypothetical protein